MEKQSPGPRIAAAGFAANFAVGDRCGSKICTNHQAGSPVALEISILSSVGWSCGAFTCFHNTFSDFFSLAILKTVETLGP